MKKREECQMVNNGKTYFNDVRFLTSKILTTGDSAVILTRCINNLTYEN